MSENHSDTESVASNSNHEPSSDPNGGHGSASTNKARKCIVISLIRHAQYSGNLGGSYPSDDDPNPLTEQGRRQADSLAKDWAETHIDHLLSSPLERAYDTAAALSSRNKCHPEIAVDPKLVERRYGEKYIRLKRQGRDEEARRELGVSSYGSLSRYHCPEGGESMSMVASRVERMTRYILERYAVNLSEAPQFFLEKKQTDAPDVLPDGIPHVVIVSHNILFMELYEKWNSWGRLHSETDCHWQNADWSRHILWYDEESDKLDSVDMKYCEKPMYGW